MPVMGPETFMVADPLTIFQVDAAGEAMLTVPLMVVEDVPLKTTDPLWERAVGPTMLVPSRNVRAVPALARVRSAPP